MGSSLVLGSFGVLTGLNRRVLWRQGAGEARCGLLVWLSDLRGVALVGLLFVVVMCWVWSGESSGFFMGALVVFDMMVTEPSVKLFYWRGRLLILAFGCVFGPLLSN